MLRPERGLAVVTGGSSGIGEAFARKLAARGFSLVLVARSAGRLAALAEELAARHGIAAEPVALDLSAPGAAEALYARTEGAGRPVALLVNNAGVGLHGALAEQPPARVEELLRLDVLALTELTQRFLAAMRARRSGAILNVASTQAFLPVPYMAAYGAAKAYVSSFTQAVHEEAERDGVVVTCLCPGYTRTRFYGASKMKGPKGTPFPEMTPDDVAEAGLAALDRGRAVAVPHPLDRLWIFTGRFVPLAVPRKLARLLMSR
jgi:short-subunit dehydrogenase